MAKLWAVKFEVKARIRLLGMFPIDMLRYDCCTPSPSIDAAHMLYSVRDIEDGTENETITLVHHSHGHKGWQPTVDRWASFGWLVVKVHPAYAV